MKKYIKHIALLSSLLLVFNGCTKDFEELNVNPNTVVEPTAASILLSAQVEIGHALLDDNDIFIINEWAQYFAPWGHQDQPYDFDWDTSNIFNRIFYNLRNLEKMKEYANRDGKQNTAAIAEIMQVWIWHNTIDIYGDFPYFDALKGEQGIYYPDFDSQKDIYYDLVKRLDEVVENMDVYKESVTPESDLFCQGDMKKWQKFANSLKARLLMNMTNTDKEFAKAGLEKLFSDPVKYPVMESNKDNVGIKYLSPQDENSYFYTSVLVEMAVRYNNIRYATTTMVDLLCANDDPRRKVMLDPSVNSVKAVQEGKATEYIYKGLPPVSGGPGGPNSEDCSAVGKGILTDFSRPVDVMTCAELLLIKAEAAAKGFNVGTDAKTSYEAGIRASMEKWGVTDEEAINNYFNSELGQYNPSTGEEQVVKQRYIDAFCQGINAFTLIRRSGKFQVAWNRVGFAEDYGFPDRLPYAKNMKVNSPGYNDAVAGIKTMLWGKTGICEGVDVPIDPAFKKSKEYKFKDR